MKPTKIKDMDLVRAAAWSPALRAKKEDPEPEEAAAQEEDILGVMDIRFSPFDTWYEIDDFFEGRFLERTTRGAFAKTIKDNGAAAFRVQFDHGYDPHIGSKILGVAESVTEERDAATGVVPLLDTSYNRDLLPGLRRGAYGSSFRFRVIKDEWNDEPERSDHNPDGIPERTIREVRLMEFGPVTWPANPDATAGMRSTTSQFMEKLRDQNPDYVRRFLERVEMVRSAAGTPDGAAMVGTSEPRYALPGRRESDLRALELTSLGIL
ncbi:MULTISPECIES: HK97 family phage prohead protease [unclassified Nonomuraea]|uniref:HK97 family phage prohead protease n=1 Tax=unclassified Nonomuraea TaxID=2593643 RepID=UPI0033C5CE31